MRDNEKHLQQLENQADAIEQRQYELERRILNLESSGRQELDTILKWLQAEKVRVADENREYGQQGWNKAHKQFLIHRVGFLSDMIDKVKEIANV